MQHHIWSDFCLLVVLFAKIEVSALGLKCNSKAGHLQSAIQRGGGASSKCNLKIWNERENYE